MYVNQELAERVSIVIDYFDINSDIDIPAPGIPSDWSILTVFFKTRKARDVRHSCQSVLWRTWFTRAISRNSSYVVFCKNVSRISQK